MSKVGGYLGAMQFLQTFHSKNLHQSMIDQLISVSEKYKWTDCSSDETEFLHQLGDELLAS